MLSYGLFLLTGDTDWPLYTSFRVITRRVSACFLAQDSPSFPRSKTLVNIWSKKPLNITRITKMRNAEDYVLSSANPGLTMSKEGLPLPSLAFAQNTEGKNRLAGAQGKENQSSSRLDRCALAEAVWPENWSGPGRPTWHAAACQAVSDESFVLWPSLLQPFPRLFCKVRQDLPMWLKKISPAHWSCTGLCWHDQDPVLAGHSQKPDCQPEFQPFPCNGRDQLQWGYSTASASRTTGTERNTQPDNGEPTARWLRVGELRAGDGVYSRDEHQGFNSLLSSFSSRSTLSTTASEQSWSAPGCHQELNYTLRYRNEQALTNCYRSHTHLSNAGATHQNITKPLPDILSRPLGVTSETELSQLSFWPLEHLPQEMLWYLGYKKKERVLQ